MRVLFLRQHRLRSVPLVHFETVMEQAPFWHESEGHMAQGLLAGPTAEGSVAVTRQAIVVLLLVMAVTHCIIAKDLFSE